MTLKDKILKFLCLKPQMPTYQNKSIAKSTKTYRGTFKLDYRLFEARFEESCYNCKSEIQGDYRFAFFRHYVTENNVERFFSNEEKIFCEVCCQKVISEAENKEENNEMNVHYT